MIFPRRHRPPEARARGSFTLVEILVVLTIVALLAALLLPSLSRSIAAGKAAKCSSNMRQCLQAIQLYENDNEMRIPPAYLDPTNRDSRGFFTWQNYVSPYLGDTNTGPTPTTHPELYNNPVFSCPANATKPVKPYTSVWGFAMNTPANGQLSLLRYANRSGIILLAEISGNYYSTVYSYSAFVVTNRHLSQANYGFVDGHVERMPYAQTYNPPANVNLWQWK